MGGQMEGGLPFAPAQGRPGTVSKWFNQGDMWLSSSIPHSARLCARYVKPIRRALSAMGAGIVALHLAGRTFSLHTGPLSAVQRAMLARPMALKDTSGHAGKHVLPPLRLH
jgi:hypothetical protein